MRRLIPLVAVSFAVVAALVGASAASANNFPIYQCPYTSTVANGSYAGNPIYVYNGGGIQQPLYLHFGWLALRSQQAQQFLNVQSSPGATITDTTTGQVVWSYSPWGIGSGTWSPIAPANGVDSNGVPFSGYATLWRVPITTLPVGTYSLSFEIDLKTGVNDGSGGAGAGAVYKTTNCQFTVQ